MNKIVFDQQAVYPSKILCIGRNYVEHITELGNEIPDDMVVFNKPNSAIGHDLLSFQQEAIHYEAELCFLVKAGRYCGVAGGLDLTKRSLQTKLKEKGLPWERAKAFDQSALFSEFVAIEEKDIDKLSFTLTINDKIVQQASIDLMMYQPLQIIEHLTSYTSLCDGDIVMTGTPKGVGQIEKASRFTLSVYLKSQLLVSESWQAI